MEFKFRAIDDNNKPPPPTASHSLSPLSYLPHPSLQMNGGFSGSPGEAALRRELEKEQIRSWILPRKELGISIPRPLKNVQGLVSPWTNSSLMSPAAVAHIGASQPPSVLPPSGTSHSPDICDKEKVIVLDKPDPNLFNAKRKATTVSEIEPFAFSLKKKPKKEWICALCEIRATNESGLNAHLNGRKHKAREAGQNGKIAKRNNKSGENVKDTQTVVATIELGADAEKDQPLPQPCTAFESMNETVVDKGVEESEKEEQLVMTVADNDTSTTESKTENFVVMTVVKNESESKNEQLVETVADNGVSVIKSTNENKLVEMIVSNDVIKFENGVLLVEKSQNLGSLESKKDAAIEEAEKISALSKRKVEPLWCEICQIYTHSKVIMEGHIKGKKHIKKMKKFEQNNASPPSTLSASQKAPMIKDT